MDQVTNPAGAGKAPLPLPTSGPIVGTTPDSPLVRRSRIAGFDLPTTYATRPLVVAHRGNSSVAPENTLLAMDLGLEAGADLLECDIRQTADHRAILFHDPTLSRITNDPQAIADYSLEELQRFDVGIWKGLPFAGQRIPTLEAALNHIGNRARLLVEIKNEAMGAAVVASLTAANVPLTSTLLISFHFDVLVAIRRQLPNVDAIWLADEPAAKVSQWEQQLSNVQDAGFLGAGLRVSDASEQRVAAVHRRGLAQFVWTANELEDMRRIVAVGADAICTDYPERMLSLFQTGCSPEAAAPLPSTNVGAFTPPTNFG